MSVAPFDSAIWGDLLGDREIGPLFSDAAEVEAMVSVERALARASARVGVVPAEAARLIDRSLDGWAPQPEALAAGAAKDGVPVPALVAAMRAALPDEAAHWVHWGATSQDIVDTGRALRLREALALLEARRARIAAALEAAAVRWRDLPMAGRTRSQIAAPIAFGDRCAAWAAPFAELGPELAALGPRIARVQLGGAVGTNAALAPHGAAVAAALAEELGLAPAAAWHANRAALGALGAWCAGAAAAAGKMAGDLVLMGRSEAGEARAAGGGSSTMPQKANPVAAETAVALARFAATLAAPLHLAALHAEERDGTAWALEWLALPQAVVAAGAALRHAAALAEGLAPDRARMRAVLDLEGGAALAEAALFALARRMPRREAEAIVRDAVAAARSGGTLAAALAARAPGPEDWTALLAPERMVQQDRGKPG